jgi:hypothetical protein
MKHFLLALAVCCSSGCFVMRDYHPAGQETYFVIPGVGEWLVRSDMPSPEWLAQIDAQTAPAKPSPSAPPPDGQISN